jgi:uncharacterized membrane protein
MNRSFLIIAIPALVVLLGYILVFRHIGVSPGYSRLAIVGGGFLLALWLVQRRSARKKKSSAE